ncbi:MAG: hypothetical protein QOI77_2400, partial [Blastocatellia bacterium]|nr:hypothetical protein [Blastocatellia bacterium]
TTFDYGGLGLSVLRTLADRMSALP